MKRWWIGLFIVTLLLAIAGGFWFTQPERQTTESAAGRSASFFLPEDPRILIRFNHTRPTLTSLEDVAMIRRFKQSRFNKALRERIVPLLSLVSSQFRANTPYPSAQVLRYFRHSTSYLVQARGEAPIFLMTPSEKQNDSDPGRLKKLVKSWILSPARNRNAWTVDQTSFRNHTIWQLTYRYPGRDLPVSFHLLTVGNHGLISPSAGSLKQTLKRFYNRKKPPYTLGDPDRSVLVDFLVTDGVPRTDTPLLKNSNGIIQPGSARSLRGSVAVEKPYLTVSARAAVPDSIPIQNVPFPEKLLGYIPPHSFAVNVLSVPSFSDTTPGRYRELLNQPGRSLLPERFGLMQVIRSLEGLEILQAQRAIVFASYLDESGRASGSQSFLLVLSPRNRSLTQQLLRKYSVEDTDSRPGEPRTLRFGSLTVRGVWDQGQFLISASPGQLERALQRHSHNEGFTTLPSYDRIRRRVPETLTSFSYFSTSPLAGALANSTPIKNTQYQLARTFMGFDPVTEISRLVEGVPGNVLITRRQPGQRNVSLRFYTAGDIFLPLALQRINPNAGPGFDTVARSFPLDMDSLRP